MSRSYKKCPMVRMAGIDRRTSKTKKMFNRRLRRVAKQKMMTDPYWIADYNEYKKYNNPWDIADYYSYMTFDRWRDLPFNDDKPEEEVYRSWVTAWKSK